MPLRPPAGFVSANYDPLKNSNPPTSPAASAGNATASVSFTAPTNTGGGAITNYYAVSNPGQIVGSSVTSPIAVSGLTNNTSYTFKVWAENAYGPSAYSAPTDAVTPANPVIEDVFSTWLYSGNGSTQSIVNGINLSSNGGMTWLKCRNNANSHTIFDTARPVTQILSSNLTSATTNSTGWGLTSFNSNGFSLNSTSNLAVNNSGETYVSWTFQKQAKFFDVVTYTGNGVNGRNISHSLGSVPGVVILKKTSGDEGWWVYHRSLGNAAFMQLNNANAVTTSSFVWNYTTPTSTTFTVSDYLNGSGQTYVAYLFAHDAGGFGDAGDQSVIKCGSFTTNGSGIATVDLGWEPQWVLIKRTDSTSEWHLLDNMRGFAQGVDAWLRANSSAAESSAYSIATPTATGFVTDGTNIIDPSATFVYIAIRRGPMKTPTTGTSVFVPIALTPTADATQSVNFPVDLSIGATRSASGTRGVTDRLRGYPSANSASSTPTLRTTSDAAETLTYPNIYNVANRSVQFGFDLSNQSIVEYFFGRAPSFFDIVCYTGNKTNRTISHNLGVAPELMIVKQRSSDSNENWAVYSAPTGNTKRLRLNANIAASVSSTFWNDTSPTSSVFTVGTDEEVNGSGSTYVTYLFATCSGVSTVGSYTGTGTTLSVNCGFTAGARFVLIKRTDDTGDWYVWDSARGIVAGNDPYLLLNNTAAEVTNTDYVDTYSAGFEISSTAPAAINANGGTFIYLAIA